MKVSGKLSLVEGTENFYILSIICVYWKGGSTTIPQEMISTSVRECELQKNMDSWIICDQRGGPVREWSMCQGHVPQSSNIYSPLSLEEGLLGEEAPHRFTSNKLDLVTP